MWWIALLGCGETQPVPSLPAAAVAQERAAAPEVRPAPEPPVTAAPEPLITIDTPPGSTVGAGPLKVSGTAMVWEGDVQVRLSQGDVVIARTHTHADAAAPARGTWGVELVVPPEVHGPAVLEAFSRSAKDGSEENVTRVPIVVR